MGPPLPIHPCFGANPRRHKYIPCNDFGLHLVKKTNLQGKIHLIAMSNVVKPFAPTMRITFILRIFAVNHLLCTDITDLILKTASYNFPSLDQNTCSR